MGLRMSSTNIFRKKRIVSESSAMMTSNHIPTKAMQNTKELSIGPLTQTFLSVPTVVQFADSDSSLSDGTITVISNSKSTNSSRSYTSLDTRTFPRSSLQSESNILNHLTIPPISNQNEMVRRHSAPQEKVFHQPQISNNESITPLEEAGSQLKLSRYYSTTSQSLDDDVPNSSRWLKKVIETDPIGWSSNVSKLASITHQASTIEVHSLNYQEKLARSVSPSKSDSFKPGRYQMDSNGTYVQRGLLSICSGISRQVGRARRKSERDATFTDTFTNLEKVFISPTPKDNKSIGTHEGGGDLRAKVSSWSHNLSIKMPGNKSIYAEPK